VSKIKAEQVKDPLNILFIAAEADPFIKIGGLGDVAGSLPVALKNLEKVDPACPHLDIRLAIPFYGMLRKQSIAVTKVTEFWIPALEKPVKAEVYETTLHSIPVYLIDGDPILPDAPVYGSDFSSDALKFIFFSLACLYLPEKLNWQIDILHANDWHTAVAVHQLQSLKKSSKAYQKVHSILSVHNLPFMGTGSENGLDVFQIAPATNPKMPKWSRTLPLPMGLNSAEKIIAVSPGYAREIKTPEYGCDLQNFLQTKSKRISGILNGIDTSLWDPSSDPLIKKNFDKISLESRVENKLELQKEFGLKVDANTPLLAFIGRMDRQKGIDLVINALKDLKNKAWQMLFLGTGDKQLESDLAELQKSYPEQIRTALRFDAPLSHRIYSGADILLMPSRYEPCGLAQMIAMRYGCIPLARATGGLIDTIIDYSESPKTATGFLFSGLDAKNTAAKLESAINLYTSRNIWEQIQKNAMNCDFSWQRSAKEYLNVYKELAQ